MTEFTCSALFEEIMRARARIYRHCRPTPLQRVEVPFCEDFRVKREDRSPVHSYKWRGACNRIAAMTPAERRRGVVAASAGNHAQGVALAARAMQCPARLYMPRSTPRMKLREVERIGGEAVEIVVAGDTYDDVHEMSLAWSRETGAEPISAFDDPLVMAGQGTIGDEIVLEGFVPDVAFLQIGGGGMAAGVACVLKSFYPEVRIVGVEGEGQACMARAVAEGRPVRLDTVDVFCDGTAVQRAGERTLPLCRELIDDFVTVSNDEVCAAIQLLWESARLISEPSGAMGVAGAMRLADELKGRRVATVLSGSNMDFVQLGAVARHAGVGLAQRRFYEFEIEERMGSILELIETAMEGINIFDVQFGMIDEAESRPVMGFEASPMQLEVLRRRLEENGIPHRDATGREDVDFRVIHYRPRLFRNPWFGIVAFPERPGALTEFMRKIRGEASICYFNYAGTGELIGRALMGFTFDSPTQSAAFPDLLRARDIPFKELSPQVLDAIL